MDTLLQYWQIVRISPAGNCHIYPLPAVKDWLMVTCASLLKTIPLAEIQLQQKLLNLWREGSPESSLVLLSLRCYTTHQIRQVCLQLTRQFGFYYGFSAKDLFPLVLDDVGNELNGYRPFTLKILESYDPTKASLRSWIYRCTKNHAELNQFLLGQGLYRASDWSILNDTDPRQLAHILGIYHRCSPQEIERAKALLTQYHRVYRADRFQTLQNSGRGQRCTPPTTDQLQRMALADSPSVILKRLKGLAGQLRQHKIHVRGGNPRLFGQATTPDDLDGFDIDQLPDPIFENPMDDDQREFLTAYRTYLDDCLGRALYQSIQMQRQQLYQRNPQKAAAYLRGLALFYIHEIKMDEIAPLLTRQFGTQLNLTRPIQIVRLLALPQLRTKVRLLMIPDLKTLVYQQAAAYLSLEQLHHLDQLLDQLLTEEVDQIISNDKSATLKPQGRRSTNHFAQKLCQVLPNLAP